MTLRKCEICGAALDPGEVCDCQQQALVTTEAPQPEAADLIRVEQLPIITERLRLVKDQVQQITQEAAGMVCTEDTLQAVKIRRAEMSKQFAELEDQRKAVKAAVLDPYNQFEATYKECVSGPFKAADAALKAKIDEVEESIKAACESRMRRYFAELCAANNLDWLEFDRMALKIDMSSARQKTPKKLMEQINEYVSTIGCGVDTIRGMGDDADEIMVEFRRELNLPRAIQTVKERKKALSIEKLKRYKDAEYEAARQAALEKVKAAVAAYAPPTESPMPAPDQPAAEPELTVTFTATATRAKLIALREYMKKEGIRYA